MVWIYAIIAGVLGFFPGISFLLVLIEAWMIHSVAHTHNVDNFGDLVYFIVSAAAISSVLKAVAHLAHTVPVIGQLANSLVAIVFIVVLFHIADSHYAHLQQTGKNPDTIRQGSLIQASSSRST